VFAHLETVFEFTLEKVCLTPVAFNEDVFRLHIAFFRRNGLNSLIFLTEPGHRNAGKGSTNPVESKLNPLLRADSGGERVFYLCHLRYQVGSFD
jgi:hypothetical protein